MNFVTVDELSVEIQKHTDSQILPELLDLLRAKHIDLREFCKRVRMVLGAEVLINTVRGLQHSQRHKGRFEQPVLGGVPLPGANGSASSVAGSLSRPGSGYEAEQDREHTPIAAKLEPSVVAGAPSCAGLTQIGVSNHALAGGSGVTSVAVEAARRQQAQNMMASGQGRQLHLQSQSLATPRPMLDPMAVAFGVSQGRVSPTLAQSWAPAAAGMGGMRIPTGHGCPATLLQGGSGGACIGGAGAMDFRQVHPGSARGLAPATGRGHAPSAAPVSASSSFDLPQLHANGPCMAGMSCGHTGSMSGGQSPPELSVQLDSQAPSAAAPPNPLRGFSMPSEVGEMDSPGKSAMRELKELSGGDGRNPTVPANFKVLIHALLCPKVAPAEQCSMEGCAKMKGLLSRVELHTKSCNAGMTQGEATECTTCLKWRQMVSAASPSLWGSPSLHLSFVEAHAAGLASSHDLACPSARAGGRLFPAWEQPPPLLWPRSLAPQAALSLGCLPAARLSPLACLHWPSCAPRTQTPARRP
jgi:hypothetical protein